MRGRNIRQTLLVLFLTTSAVLVSGLSHGSVFWDDSFETCAVGGGTSFPCEGWDDFGQEVAGVIDVTTDQVFSGSRAFKQTLTKKDLPGGNVYKPSIYKSYTDITQSHIFARWAIKWSDPFEYCTINGVTKIVRFVLNGGFPKVWVINYFGNYSMLVEAPYYGGTERIDTNVPVVSGVWDQLEFEWQLNTPGSADGTIRLWKNGAVLAERVGKEFIGPLPTSVHPIYGAGYPTPSTARHHNTQIYVQCGIGNVWYDRFATGTTRIGSVFGGDTLPPSPPQGLVLLP